MPLKLNIGCGETKLEGFVNIDMESEGLVDKVKPDVICNIATENLPFEVNSVDTIYFIHAIEHLPMKCWAHVFDEFRRVLIEDGLLVLAYPEWETCVKYFIENKNGQKAFWRACLYGRQLYNGDFHVSPIITTEMVECLRQMGFNKINYCPDDEATYYTFLSCHKSKVFTREDVLKKEIFGDIHRIDNRFKLASLKNA